MPQMQAHHLSATQSGQAAVDLDLTTRCMCQKPCVNHSSPCVRDLLSWYCAPSFQLVAFN